MHYTQFYYKYHSGIIGEALGSDSVFILDGRNSINTMITDSYNRATQLQNVAKFTHFAIFKSPDKRFSNGHAITSKYPISEPHKGAYVR